jgi:hypothetical protein
MIDYSKFPRERLEAWLYNLSEEQKTTRERHEKEIRDLLEKMNGVMDMCLRAQREAIDRGFALMEAKQEILLLKQSR